MPRKKIIKEGYHLRYIPAGKMTDFIKMAQAHPMKDKMCILWKYVETYSDLIERCKNNETYFVASSQKILDAFISCNNSGRILNDMVTYGLLKKDKSTYKMKKKSYSYKPVHQSYDIIKIYRNFLNKATDFMLSDKFNVNNLKDTEQLYYKSFTNLSIDKGIINYLSNQYPKSEINKYLSLLHITLFLFPMEMM